MKITVYSTSDCPFSKQEKDYLTSKGAQFEEKNIQTNREFLTEMLGISNNFAGTPVTKIDMDDGQSTILKGFTQSDFDNVFSSNIQAVNATIPKPVPPVDDQTQTPPTPEPIEKPEEISIPPIETPVPEPIVETPTPQPVPVEIPVEIPASEPIAPESIPTPEPAPVEPTLQTPESITPEPVPATPPVEQPKADEALSSILDSLKTKSEEPSQPTPTATA